MILLFILFSMKNFIKFLIIVWLSLLLWWTVFTQTPRWQEYARDHLAPDANLIRSKLLNALNATGVVMTGTLPSLSGWEIQYSESGAIVVDQSVLDQRLEYYRQAKDQLWKENK